MAAEASPAGPTVAPEVVMSRVVPENFGMSGGPTVTNKDTILSEIDNVLNNGRPPAVEYLLVLPYSLFKIPGTDIGISYNAFGHSAVRYTMPNGEQRVMNIDGTRYNGIVNFSSPTEYIYGTSAPQGGIYNRDIMGIRIENLPPERVVAMDAYYRGLACRNVDDQVRFHLFLAPLFNMLRVVFPTTAERGNCARYTSKGLDIAGVTTNTSMWPKSIFINIFENAKRTTAGSNENVHVVSYRRARDAHLRYGVDAPTLEGVAPMQSLRSFMYYRLERFAHVIVEVPHETTEAVVRIQENPVPPSEWRNLVNSKFAIATSLVVSVGLVRYAWPRLLVSGVGWVGSKFRGGRPTAD